MTTTLPTCQARYGTPRDLSRPTLGPVAAQLTEHYLGRRLMPWQRAVLDVALEVDPATGRLAYREVVLTVPRQSGKTTLLLSVILLRCMSPFFGGRQRCVYSAQTGKDARAKWEDDFVADLEGSKRLAGKFVVSRGSGREAVKFPNGSRFGISANTEKSGHGSTLDLPIIDEAFAQIDDRLEQAFAPAMITRPQPQRWVVSTAGTEESVYLKAKVDKGRQLAEAGDTGSGVAYFEWSAPDDADPADPETWRSCMPALGHTVTEAAIRSEFTSMKLSEFRRAFLNQWVARGADEQVVPSDAWDTCRDVESEIAGRLVLALDVAPDRGAAAIAAAGDRADGRSHVQVLQHGPGTEWVVDRVVDLCAEHGTDRVVLDPAGPAGALIPALRARGIEPVATGWRDMAQACGALYDAVLAGRFRHLGQRPLDDALKGARKRDLGDAWAFGRKASGVDITPLVAVTLAAWGLSTAPAAREPYDLLDSFG
jgi:hypothetical protein